MGKGPARTKEAKAKAEAKGLRLGGLNLGLGGKDAGFGRTHCCSSCSPC